MKYRSKPVVIEAWQFNSGDYESMPVWLRDYRDKTLNLPCLVTDDGNAMLVPTLEGTMRASLGDWIIKGTEGELYPCKDSVFKTKYEAVE
jgi:hypothetical protein